MRVITGIARGRRLATVPGSDIVRPTSERVKEGLFSAIQFDIEGRRVLDLFAGSGQLGIEALSRGAEHATFVDVSDVSLGVVKQNLENTGLSSRARLVKSDYASFAAVCRETFDIAFFDPPFQAGLLEKAVAAAAPHMKDSGVLLCEHPADLQLSEEIGGFSVQRVYRYGKVAVTLYRKVRDIGEK